MPFRTLVGLVGLCLALFLGMGAYFTQLPCTSLDVRLTVASAMEAVECYGPDGRALHRWGTRNLDALFPFLLASTLLLGLLRYAKGRRRGTLSVLVLFYILSDQIENMAILRLLELDFRWSETKTWATWVKYLTVVLPAVLVIAAMWREWRTGLSSGKD